MEKKRLGRDRAPKKYGLTAERNRLCHLLAGLLEVKGVPYGRLSRIFEKGEYLFEARKLEDPLHFNAGVRYLVTLDERVIFEFEVRGGRRLVKKHQVQARNEYAWDVLAEAALGKKGQAA